MGHESARLPSPPPPPSLFLRTYVRCIFGYLCQGRIVNSCSRFVRKTLDAASYDDLLDPVGRGLRSV